VVGAPGPGDAIPVPRLEAPILLAVGSHDPITVAQIDRLAGTGKAAIAAAPEGACPTLAPGAAGVMRLVAVEGRAFDARAAGAQFAREIGKVVREGDVRTLLGCGGETADAILGELGAGVLVIECEVLPGVPASSIVLGDRRLKVVTKSGGFGGEDALVAVVAAATDPREGAS
jgi:uncharacterized protein YgbK (DUF1537 family)